jgi:hypothetical protein
MDIAAIQGSFPNAIVISAHMGAGLDYESEERIYKDVKNIGKYILNI